MLRIDLYQVNLLAESQTNISFNYEREALKSDQYYMPCNRESPIHFLGKLKIVCDRSCF